MLSLQIANLGNMGVISCLAGELCYLSALNIDTSLDNITPHIQVINQETLSH